MKPFPPVNFSIEHVNVSFQKKKKIVPVSRIRLIRSHNKSGKTDEVNGGVIVSKTSPSVVQVE